MIVWPPQTCPRPSLPPRPAGGDFRLRGGIHDYGYVYETTGGQLVPLHLPRPLRDPLRGLELGCLRTRAMVPLHLPRPLR